MDARADDLLRRSGWYRRYSRAFQETTGFSVHLVSEPWLENRGCAWEAMHPFCEALHASIGTPCSCRRPLMKLARDSRAERPGLAKKVRCAAGLSMFAFPLGVGGDDPILLVVGRVLDLGHGTNGKNGVRSEFRRRLTVLLNSTPREEKRRVLALARTVMALPAQAMRARLRLSALLASQLASVTIGLLERNHRHERNAIRKARDIVGARHSENIHLPMVARLCGLSRHHFSRVFHRETGTTFSAYLGHARVGHMRRLLETGGCSVSEAAFAAGFQSISQANRLFRAATGVCPSKLRAAGPAAGRCG